MKQQIIQLMEGTDNIPIPTLNVIHCLLEHSHDDELVEIVQKLLQQS